MTCRGKNDCAVPGCSCGTKAVPRWAGAICPCCEKRFTATELGFLQGRRRGQRALSEPFERRVARSVINRQLAAGREQSSQLFIDVLTSIASEMLVAATKHESEDA